MQQQVFMLQDLHAAVCYFIQANVTLKAVIKKLLDEMAGAKETAVYRYNGFSGYKIPLQKGGVLEVLFAPLFTGESVLQFNECQPGTVVKTSYCYFDQDGKFLNTTNFLDRSILFVDLTNMEPFCPIVNHIYNCLAYEYQQATTGHAKSKRILCFEALLQELAAVITPSSAEQRHFDIGVQKLTRDPAFRGLRAQIIDNGLDSALTYMERLQAWSLLKAEFTKTLRTKKRCHRLGWATYQFPLLVRLWLLSVTLFWKRPGANLRGLAYRFSVVKVLWFFSTVRKNLGYSIALAIYGPFTYFFITQPMNPHAMEAVGKVRAAYLGTVAFFETHLGTAADLNGVADAPAPEGGGARAVATPAPTAAPTPASAPTPVAVAKRDVTAQRQPQFAQMFVSPEFPAVNEQPWSERMSRFKDLQISYEANLRFAERMGRLEQMETQLNFSLIAESAYRELERYDAQVAEFMSDLSNADNGSGQHDFSDLLRYFKAERQRTQGFQLYVWDKLVRYMLDHRYIVLDSDNEQKRIDSYFGRSFSFLQEITLELARSHKQLPLPAEFERVKELAKRYEAIRKIPKGGLAARLQQNLLLAKQKDFLSTDELRNDLKRQWEILYLIQNKAQEASHFGLQMYTWSVRNAVWGIESLHSAKRRELALWRQQLLPGSGGVKALVAAEKKNMNIVDAKKEIFTKIEPLYESLFHIMSLEYVSIRKEMKEHLPDDIESVQREAVLTLIQNFFSDRDVLLLKPQFSFLSQ